VLRAARTEPQRLVIGIDADAASMRASSSAASKRKNSVPNALFVVAAVERLPDELTAVADRITVHFPWGSLLRGLVQGADHVLGSIADLATSGGHLEAMWSLLFRDRAAAAVTPLPDDVLRRAFETNGFDLIELRPASLEEVRATGSSWGKRLEAGSKRPTTLLRARKR
jgi:16S rRNA (adenine(1408)-N(1))-methyltransferase